jgi:hypothetical protein
MDQCKYDFIIMMKGMKELAAQAIEECAGRFEKNRKNRITEYNVSGMTIKKRLFPSDEKERYFHVYYNDWKAASEREEFEKKLDKISRFLKKNMGENIEMPEGIGKYFDLVYWHSSGHLFHKNVFFFNTGRFQGNNLPPFILICT